MTMWRVSDPCTCNEEDFETEDEALAFAQKLLKGHREEAVSEGEWSDETDRLRVYKLMHSAEVVSEGEDEDGSTWVEYGLRQAT